MALHAFDWTIIIIYLIGMIGLSFFLARGQKTGRDYYLGGNKTAPLPIALSTMATQCSTNSLLGAPAFVAFAAGGGMIWLQYELAVPFAMIVLMALIFPVLRSLRLISLYAYLEKRFDATTRTIISIFFQFMRAFSTGVTVYGISLASVIDGDLCGTKRLMKGDAMPHGTSFSIRRNHGYNMAGNKLFIQRPESVCIYAVLIG